jgi:hypothetical protein
VLEPTILKPALRRSVDAVPVWLVTAGVDGVWRTARAGFEAVLLLRERHHRRWEV